MLRIGSNKSLCSVIEMSLRFGHLIALICSVGSINSAHILGLFPVASKSHFSCNYAIMRSLHAVGHHITLVSPFPSEVEIENLTFIDSRSDTFIYVGQSTIQDFDKSMVDMMDFVFNTETQYCYDVIKLPVIQEALHSSAKLYDVIFVELLMAYECFLPVAQKLGIPVIGTITLHSWKLADYSVGLPNNPAVIPLEVSASKPEMNFIERIENLWNHFIVDFYFGRRKNKVVEKFYREHFTEDLVYKKKISLTFYNNHASLLPRAIPPNAIEVGGIHVSPAKPLPEELKKFIDEASYGVVLFTFGSVVRASSLSLQQRNAFLAAFQVIPQRVIWKFEEEIENLPKNVLLLKWLPQRDILEHKNVIVFMSHCGQSGVYEAVITGTPVVTMPIFSDQYLNAALLHYRGVGINLDLKTVTKESVLTALNTIVNNTNYYQRMQELSKVFKDRPMTPQDEVVYWTEYVIRHNGAPHLKALGSDMPLYKYLMLDIIVLAMISISVAIFLICVITKKMYTFRYETSAKKDN